MAKKDNPVTVIPIAEDSPIIAEDSPIIGVAIRTKALNTLQREVAGTALNPVAMEEQLTRIVTTANHAEDASNKEYANVGREIFALRRMFLTAKLPTWSAFLSGEPPFEACGLLKITGISRTTALRYLALFNAQQGLPQGTPAALITAINSKYAGAFKAVQQGRLIEYLSSAAGKAAVASGDFSTPESAKESLNQMVKDLKATRGEREQLTTAQQLRQAIARVYLGDGIGKTKAIPGADKPRARMSYLLGMERFLNDVSELPSLISAFKEYGASVTVHLGSIDAAIARMSQESKQTA